MSDWYPAPANEDLSTVVVIGNPQHRGELVEVQLQDSSRHIQLGCNLSAAQERKNTAKLEIGGEQGQTPRWYLTLMAVSISCPQLGDAALRTQLTKAVQSVVKRWRPSFERWRLSLFRSQSGDGWDLAISGPRFRKIFTLNGPVDDLPGLVSAYIDAILAQVTEPSHARPRPSGF